MFRPDRELCPVPEPDSKPVRFWNRMTSSRTGRPVRELVNHVRPDRELCPVPEPGSLDQAHKTGRNILTL